jgi:hypothetical protein
MDKQKQIVAKPPRKESSQQAAYEGYYLAFFCLTSIGCALISA